LILLLVNRESNALIDIDHNPCALRGAPKAKIMKSGTIVSKSTTEKKQAD
jgi:hypothetical protein